MKMVSSRFGVASALQLFAVLLIASGCGGRSDLGRVTGKVTLDGQPLVDAFVEFAPQSQGSVAYGRTDENGEYDVMFSRDVKGASVGENLVRISTYDLAIDENGNEVSIPERVPAEYNVDSTLLVTVEQGDNRHDFDLDSKVGKVEQPEMLPGT